MRLAVEVIQDKSVLCFQMMISTIYFLFTQKAPRGPRPFVLQKLSCEFVRDGCLLHIYLIDFFCICCLYIYGIGDETLAAHILCLGLVSFHSHLFEL